MWLHITISERTRGELMISSTEMKKAIKESI